MATYHSPVIRKVNSASTIGIGWMPECSCGKWKTAVVCGTYDAAQRSWEDNHVALYMTEEIEENKRKAREEIRQRVLSKFIGV